MFLLVSTDAKAVPAPQLVDPSRVKEQFEEHRFDPDVKPRITVQEAVAVKAPKGAEKIKINLSEIKIKDMNVYTAAEINAIYADKIGKTITLADLYVIAQEITRKYRNDGYVLTQLVVPPQTIDKKGKIELRAVEGFISTIAVEGTRNDKEKALIESYLNKIDRTKALNIRDLEHALLLVNSIPGVSARSILSPSANKVGGADLSVIVEHKAYKGSLGLNNFGTKYLGMTQASSEMSFHSLLGNNERITTQFVVAPDRHEGAEMFYASAGYSQPINSYGTSMTLSGNNANTKPGSSLASFDAKGRSTGVVARLDHPIVRSRDFNLRSNIEFNYTNTRSKDNLGGPVIRDRTRVVRVGGSVDGLDTLFNAGYNSLAITASKGIDVMNATNKHQDDTTSPDSNGNQFEKIEAEIMRQQLITNDISLFLAAKGQLANGGLLSGEGFGVGGINWGRGYDNSEIVGDDGYAVKGELQWTDPVRVDFVSGYSVFAFYDLGKTWSDTASLPLDKQTRTSTGLGLRADVTEDVSANAIIAVPINREVAAEGDDNPRIFAGISKTF